MNFGGGVDACSMVNWGEMKREYETTKSTLAKFAKKHGIPSGTIQSQINT
ncbi:hypothetical protein ACTHQ8_19695 [Lysinibacillus odysseyi]|nr:hypothetical protein [Lysinibacillus odysseyi]